MPDFMLTLASARLLRIRFFCFCTLVCWCLRPPPPSLSPLSTYPSPFSDHLPFPFFTHPHLPLPCSIPTNPIDPTPYPPPFPWTDGVSTPVSSNPWGSHANGPKAPWSLPARGKCTAQGHAPDTRPHPGNWRQFGAPVLAVGGGERLFVAGALLVRGVCGDYRQPRCVWPMASAAGVGMGHVATRHVPPLR